MLGVHADGVSNLAATLGSAYNDDWEAVRRHAVFSASLLWVCLFIYLGNGEGHKKSCVSEYEDWSQLGNSGDSQQSFLESLLHGGAFSLINETWTRVFVAERHFLLCALRKCFFPSHYI